MNSEDDLIDALILQAKLLNPYLGIYNMATDPSLENFAKMMYIPAIATGATAALYWSPFVGPAGRIGFRHAAMGVNVEVRKQINKAAWNTVRYSVRAAPYLAPVAAAAAGAYVYEKEVNEPLRKKAHGGAASNIWFGPFASGFGTVVG